MAWESVGGTLQWKVDTGVRVDGKAVYRTQSQSGIDPEAPEANIKKFSDAYTRFLNSGVSETIFIIRKLVA